MVIMQVCFVMFIHLLYRLGGDETLLLNIGVKVLITLIITFSYWINFYIVTYLH